MSDTGALKSFGIEKSMRRRNLSDPILPHETLDSKKRLCSSDKGCGYSNRIETKAHIGNILPELASHRRQLSNQEVFKAHATEKELHTRIKELEDTLEASKGAITSLANLVVLYRVTYGRLEQDVEAFDEDEHVEGHRGRKRTRSCTRSGSDFSRSSSCRGRYRSRAASHRSKSRARYSETRLSLAPTRSNRSCSSSSRSQRSRHWSDHQREHRKSVRRPAEWFRKRSTSRRSSKDMSLTSRSASPLAHGHCSPMRRQNNKDDREAQNHRQWGQYPYPADVNGAASDGALCCPKRDIISRIGSTEQAQHTFPSDFNEVASVEGSEINGWEAEFEISEIQEDEGKCDDEEYLVNDGWKIREPSSSPRRDHTYPKETNSIIRGSGYQHRPQSRPSWRHWTNPALKQTQNLRISRGISANEKHRRPRLSPPQQRWRADNDHYQRYDRAIERRSYNHKPFDFSNRSRVPHGIHRLERMRSEENISRSFLTSESIYAGNNKYHSGQLTRAPFPNRDLYNTPHRSSKRMRDTEPVSYQRSLPFEVNRDDRMGDIETSNHAVFNYDYLQHPTQSQRESEGTIACTLTAAATTKRMGSELAMRIESQASYECGRRGQFWSEKLYRYSGRVQQHERPRPNGWKR